MSKGKGKFKEKHAAFHSIYSLPVSPLNPTLHPGESPVRQRWGGNNLGTEKINLLASLEWYLYPAENYL